jgi:hypothetical protein
LPRHSFGFLAADARFGVITGRVEIAVKSRSVDGRPEILGCRLERLDIKFRVADRLGLTYVLAVIVKEGVDGVGGNAFIGGRVFLAGGVELDRCPAVRLHPFEEAFALENDVNCPRCGHRDERIFRLILRVKLCDALADGVGRLQLPILTPRSVEFRCSDRRCPNGGRLTDKAVAANNRKFHFLIGEEVSVNSVAFEIVGALRDLGGAGQGHFQGRLFINRLRCLDVGRFFVGDGDDVGTVL